MYLADAFNSLGLFQSMGGLLEASPEGSTAQRAIRTMLQRAYMALVHIEQCSSLASQALSQFARLMPHVEGSPSQLRAWSPMVADVLVELSAAMAALRILQDAVWRVAFAKSPDGRASMHDAYKALSRHYAKGEKRPPWVSTIPSPIRKAIVDYWQNEGARLAAYRDVDQHHDVLARMCVLDVDGTSASRLWVWLPDNPEAKSAQNFTYSSSVDGIALSRQAFNKLHELAESCAAILGATPVPLKRTIVFQPEVRHEEGVRRSTALVALDHAGRSAMILGQNETGQVSIYTVPTGDAATGSAAPGAQ
jgi:hypothetical protein